MNSSWEERNSRLTLAVNSPKRSPLATSLSASGRRTLGSAYYLRHAPKLPPGPIAPCLASSLQTPTPCCSAAISGHHGDLMHPLKPHEPCPGELIDAIICSISFCSSRPALLANRALLVQSYHINAADDSTVGLAPFSSCMHILILLVSPSFSGLSNSHSFPVAAIAHVEPCSTIEDGHLRQIQQGQEGRSSAEEGR